MKMRMTCLALLVAAGVTPALAQDKTFELKISHWVPASHPLQKSLEDWAAAIDKDSGGTIKAKIVPAERSSEKAPDYRVFAGAIEFGAGWKKKSEQGRDYVSLKFDDPSFPNPIYATMVAVEGEEGLPVIWSRPNRD